MLYAFELFYFLWNYEEMDSDVKKWRDNLVGNLFSFCTAVFVNDIPDILFGLSLLVLFPPLWKWIFSDQEYFRVNRGSHLEHFAGKTSETTSGLHRKECYNCLCLPVINCRCLPQASYWKVVVHLLNCIFLECRHFQS